MCECSNKRGIPDSLRRDFEALACHLASDALLLRSQAHQQWQWGGAEGLFRLSSELATAAAACVALLGDEWLGPEE